MVKVLKENNNHNRIIHTIKTKLTIENQWNLCVRWLNQWQLRGFLKNKITKVSHHKMEEYIDKNWWNSCVNSKGFNNKICLYNNKDFKAIKIKPKNRMDTTGALLTDNNCVLRVQSRKFKINIKLKNQKNINSKKDKS